MGHELNADYSVLAGADANQMDWVESPTPGVWRKRFDYSGPEEWGRATSLVRYDPGADRFKRTPGKASAETTRA